MTVKPLKVLMCAPAHYDIRYEINPWMDLHNPIDPQRARAQWNNLLNVLTHLGVLVTRIAQRKACPDMVFTANAGVVRNKIFVPSHFRFVERRLEEPAFTAFFKRHGYQIRDAARGLFFEGEGDLLEYRGMLFGGHRFRSEVLAHEQVSVTLGKRLIALDLIEPHFYHLDTCFFPLDDEAALYYPGAFSREGRRLIARYVRQPIAVGARDARQFACNGFRVGRTVVLNQASRALKAVLARRGYGVVESPTTEFMKAGGSVKCLLLRL